ncbi:ABC transporter permease [Hydrogenimonas thermophila]|uniref:ABC transporter permease n=1 Tax=Hydrogenimonas thermophila TaxID=223786 RepID=UPI002937465E|nr:ABC transporter permease [Hydrogenimonas thermophila]WOE69437.1 ABC transporter permease [Hydrogenimonas thermophila]WOE71947.1 ABC transporter permease [Hydrogenimonas thermophila]
MKRKPFTIFNHVVKALVIREIQARFSSQKLGYLWAIIDPMVMIVAFSLVKMLFSHSSNSGYDYPVFLAVNFLAFDLFRNISLRSMDAFSANKGLFVYKQVKPFDTLVSKTIVESLIIGIVTIIFILIGLYFDFNMDVKDINMVIFGFLWIIAFAFGLGLFFAVIGTFYENFKKLVRIAYMPLLFVSALFYTVESLPPVARDVVLFNPLVHFIELIHGSYFHVLDTKYVDFTYMIFWTLLPFFLGLWIYVKSERKIVMS